MNIFIFFGIQIIMAKIHDHTLDISRIYTVPPRVTFDYEEKLIISVQKGLIKCMKTLPEEKCLQIFFDQPYFWD